MQGTYKAIIADTSCLILLDKIDAVSILRKLFGTITTSVEIAREFGKPLPEWVEIRSAQDHNFQKAMFLEVDLGEASAITLATEMAPSLLIIDDLKGRKLAHRLQLNYTGTLGILLKAKKEAVIPALRPYFEKIQATNFRISPKLFGDILKAAGE